ncbi:hypothetical protein ACFL6E_00620 [Candidatus Neomarinimicrobiota bacterium]
MHQIVNTKIISQIIAIGCVAALTGCDILFPPDEDNSYVCETDTTSHAFIWEIDTIGTAFSWLNDVSMVDENDIWAAGDIEVADSSYNVAHWDGFEWEYFRVLGRTAGGSLSFGTMRCIKAFSNDDVWVFSNFGAWVHWDGETWATGYVNAHKGMFWKVWGTSSSDFYIVGTNGSITHYDGTSFSLMDSGTDIDLRGIWGTADGKVFVNGHDDLHATVLLELKKGLWDLRYDENSPIPSDYGGRVERVYRLFAWGDTLYADLSPGFLKSSISSGKNDVRSRGYVQMGIESVGIRGNCYNDIIIVDAYGVVTHYNGKSWKKLHDLYNRFPAGVVNLWGMDFKGNYFIAVGDYMNGGQAFVLRGYRDP